jgi:GNAT superfamily N-acetyltransferase
VDELSHAVSIHQRAFPGFFLTFLGPRFLNLLYRFYIQGDSEIALVAELEGVTIGTLLGTARPEGFYRRLATRHFVAFGCSSIQALLRRPTVFPRLMRGLSYRGDSNSLPSGGALLSSVCVDPGFHGKSVGRRLVEEFESEMWRRGLEFVYLTTDADNNETVHSFYEGLGWSIESEFATPEGRTMRRYWKKPITGR